MRRRPAPAPHAQQQVAQVALGLGAARPGPAGTSGIRRCYHAPRSRKWEQDDYRSEDEVTGDEALASAFTHAVFSSDLASGLIEEAKNEYRASKNTPERLEQHRACMAFFNGSGDSADLDPDFNPLYDYWKTWASSVQFIHSRDYPLLFSHPEGTQGDRRQHIAIQRYSFAVPSRQVLEYMVKRAPGGRIAEIGAGSGYWARLLEKLGADVVAVDNGAEQRVSLAGRSFFPACKRQDGAKFLAGGGADGRALFLCWPRTKRENPAVSTFLDKYRGDTIFFVGEVDGATFCMMDWLEEHKRQGWFVEEMFPIPTWAGTRDKFMCFSRVAGSGPVHKCKFSNDELYR